MTFPPLPPVVPPLREAKPVSWSTKRQDSFISDNAPFSSIKFQTTHQQRHASQPAGWQERSRREGRARQRQLRRTSLRRSKEDGQGEEEGGKLEDGGKEREKRFFCFLNFYRGEGAGFIISPASERASAPSFQGEAQMLFHHGSKAWLQGTSLDPALVVKAEIDNEITPRAKGR